MNTKAFFPCGGGSNLILGISRENQIFLLRTLAAVKFFHQIVHPTGKNLIFPSKYLKADHFEKKFEQGVGHLKMLKGRGVLKTKNVKPNLQTLNFHSKALYRPWE